MQKSAARAILATTRVPDPPDPKMTTGGRLYGMGMPETEDVMISRSF